MQNGIFFFAAVQCFAKVVAFAHVANNLAELCKGASGKRHNFCLTQRFALWANRLFCGTCLPFHTKARRRHTPYCRTNSHRACKTGMRTSLKGCGGPWLRNSTFHPSPSLQKRLRAMPKRALCFCMARSRFWVIVTSSHASGSPVRIFRIVLGEESVWRARFSVVS